MIIELSLIHIFLQHPRSNIPGGSYFFGSFPFLTLRLPCPVQCYTLETCASIIISFLAYARTVFLFFYHITYLPICQYLILNYSGSCSPSFTICIRAFTFSTDSMSGCITYKAVPGMEWQYWLSPVPSAATDLIVQFPPVLNCP